MRDKRPRVVAASAATLIAAAFLSPATADAAGQNVLYVDSGNSACTDSGSGTYAAPFCSIQAAADVANPGDVVSISGNNYASGATITRSGTAAAPIVFTSGGTRRAAIGIGSTASSELTISGASNVEIENLTVYSGTTAAVTVDGGSDDTIANDFFASEIGAGLTSVRVTGDASGVTVRDSTAYQGVVVDGGATGTVVSTNNLDAQDTVPLSVQGATNTALTSNTIYACSPGISVTGSSAGTSIENNIVTVLQVSACPAVSTAFGVLVDAGSAGSTKLDYNDVYGSLTGTGTAYSWNGASYATSGALYTQTGQGKHDYNGSDGASVAENSPIINSADSAAIGEQSVDINGNPRTLDPLVTPTGAGPDDDYDRGATQFQDPYTAVNSSMTLSQTKIPLGTSVTVNAVLADTWGDKFTSYEFEFGGSSIVSSTPTATLTPTADGTYTVTPLVATSGSSTYRELNGVISGPNFVDVVPPQPLVPQVSLTASGSLGVEASDNGTTDAWNITAVSYDFGDGTPVQQGSSPAYSVAHTYAKAGTYTVTETVTDADGNTAKTTSTFSTNDPAVGTLSSVVTGGGVPADSTGIAQAAVSGVTSGGQILAATTSGQVEFSTSDINYNWQAWQTLSQPGVTVRWVGLAGMPDNSSQLIELTSAGKLLHTIRNANGTWQSSGWGSPAGSTGFVRAAITAMPNGSAQLVAVTSSGVLMHNIRFANGSWQGWRALSQPGVTIIDASIAGEADGSSQIVEVTSGHVMKHTIRFANGSWQKQGWGTPAGATDIVQASIATIGGGATQIVATEGTGAGEFIARNTNGSWNGWQQADIAPMLSISSIEAGWVPDENVHFIAVSGG